MPLTRLPLTDFRKLAEGIERPEDVVVSRDGRVFASVHQATVAEILPDGTFKHLGPKRGAPNGINIDQRGQIIVANFGIYDREAGPLEAFDLETGARAILLAAVEGRRLTASNYPLIDSAGNIWCANSTSAASWPEALDGRTDGFIYVMRPDGSSSIVADALKFPNGLAISADERTLFCCQTTGADVLRFSILPGGRLGTGERYGPRLGFIPPFAPNPNLRLPGLITRFLGYTDGCGMDAEGNLWVTLPAAHKIVAITPSGERITLAHDPNGRILHQPTNVAWGGPDLRDLYIGSLSAPYVLKGRSPVPGLKLVHQK